MILASRWLCFLLLFPSLGFACPAALDRPSAKLPWMIPAPSSRRFQQLSRELRVQFERTKSYAVLDVADLFPPSSAALLFSMIAHPDVGQLAEGQDREFRRRRLDPPADTTVYQAMTRARRFVRALIEDALHPPDERLLEEGRAVIRYHKKGSEKNAHQVAPNWHLDGGGFSATLAVAGSGTDFVSSTQALDPANLNYTWMNSGRAKFPIEKVNAGKLLIFLGGDLEGAPKSWRSLWHRSPLDASKDDRILLVFRY